MTPLAWGENDDDFCAGGAGTVEQGPSPELREARGALQRHTLEAVQAYYREPEQLEQHYDYTPQELERIAFIIVDRLDIGYNEGEEAATREYWEYLDAFMHEPRLLREMIEGQGPEPD